MAHHAKKGGEIGANGEFYKGGQFVADCEDTVKGLRQHPHKKTRKVQIAPYQWVEVDRDYDSIFEHLVFGVVKWADWGKKVELAEGAAEICTRCEWNLDNFKALIDKWNAGERLISRAEYVEHFSYCRLG